MGVLTFVIQQHPAVLVAAVQLHTVPAEQLYDDVPADGRQVAGDDQVKIGGPLAAVPEEGAQGLVSALGHGGTHVGAVGDTGVIDAARSGGSDAHRGGTAVQHHGAGGGGGPLGGGRPLAAVFQRIAVLALRRAEVRGGQTQRPLGKPAGYQRGAQDQALRHGGAGAVQAEIGHAHAPHGITGGDALVQKVSPQSAVQPGGGQARLVQRRFTGDLHHAAFGLLPGLFAEAVFPGNIVKAAAQGAFALLGAHGGGPGLHPHRGLEKQRIAHPAHPITSISHKITP